MLPILFGQETILARLCKLVSQNRLPHAILLVDRPSISMGLTLAEHLAAFMHCKNKTDGKFCGKCINCQQIAKHSHPDLHYVFPIINSKDKKNQGAFMRQWQQFLQTNHYPQLIDWLQQIGAGDTKNKQGNISKEACDTLLREAQLNSGIYGGKIFIIWLAEFLGTEGNRLLKIIEEPYLNTFFFVITHSQEHILPTIRSRMQTIYLRPVPESDILNYLNNTLKLPMQKAQALSIQTGANMGDILQLIKDDDSQFWDLLKLFLNAGFTNRIVIIQDFLKLITNYSREEVKAFLGYLINIFASALRLHYLENNNQVGQQAEIIIKIKERMSVSAIDQFLNILSSYHYYILRNADIKLTLHSLLLQCRMILTKAQWNLLLE